MMRKLKVSYANFELTESFNHSINVLFENKTDKEIWEEFKKGNRKALIYIYQQYFPLLCNYGIQFTKDTDVIKDCIQELFIDLSSSKENLCETTSIKFYLYRSLRRRIAKVCNNSLLSFYGSNENDKTFQVQNSPEMQLISEETVSYNKSRLNTAINKLPKRQREAIYYFFYENFSYQEIALLMGMTKVKSARSLIYKAIESLRGSITFTDLALVVIILMALATFLLK
ncbi:RNA polymerase sigma factor [Chondrinema litorale]|uniref:RNA polymerase sigma factor n=1 Tax=Chondrinema litorale TaxID=2994555 RepID=UPI0025438294|nr:sigma-70 family RNA polymerase sigma factor [Chondrinema litorale]UZR96275.1 sigma-70 family RNA polymerase sigma factor [Chondrinema litorale]